MAPAAAAETGGAGRRRPEARTRRVCQPMPRRVMIAGRAVIPRLAAAHADAAIAPWAARCRTRRSRRRTEPRTGSRAVNRMTQDWSGTKFPRPGPPWCRSANCPTSLKQRCGVKVSRFWVKEFCGFGGREEGRHAEAEDRIAPSFRSLVRSQAVWAVPSHGEGTAASTDRLCSRWANSKASCGACPRLGTIPMSPKRSRATGQPNKKRDRPAMRS